MQITKNDNNLLAQPFIYLE